MNSQLYGTWGRSTSSDLNEYLESQKSNRWIQLEQMPASCLSKYSISKMAVSAQKLVSEQKPNFADKKEMRAHVRIHIQRRLSTILDCALQTLRNALVIWWVHKFLMQCQKRSLGWDTRETRNNGVIYLPAGLETKIRETYIPSSRPQPTADLLLRHYQISIAAMRSQHDSSSDFLRKWWRRKSDAWHRC